jgi:hypothetical protein
MENSFMLEYVSKKGFNEVLMSAFGLMAKCILENSKKEDIIRI